LLDSALFPSGSVAAVVNEGALFARNLLTTQATAIQKGAVTVAGPTVTEYRSSATTRFNTTDTESLNLSVEETPERPTLAAGDWANAGDYGAVADNSTDDSAAIQAALNSGKRWVYLPATPGQPNVYRVKDKLVIPPGVEIFDANHCLFNPVQNINSPQIVLEAAAPSGVAPALHLSNLSATTYRARILLNPGRDYMLRSVEQIGVATAGTRGRLFLQDYVIDLSGSLYVGPGWKVWARHYNPEGRKMQDLTVNDGADLWVLGFKTELPVVNLHTTNNGRSEILGGNLFPVTASHPQLPPFIVTSGGQLSASVVLASDDPNDDFGNVVGEGVWSGSALARSDSSVPVRSLNDSTLVLLRATYTATDPVVAEARTSATLSATPSPQLWFHADGAFDLDRQADGSRRVRSWKSADGSYGTVGEDYLCRFFQPERRATTWPGGLAAVRFDYSVLLFPDSVFINSYSGSTSKVTWAIAFAPDDYSTSAPKQILFKLGGTSNGMMLYTEGGQLWFHVFRSGPPSWSSSVSRPLPASGPVRAVAILDATAGTISLVSTGQFRAEGGGAQAFPNLIRPEIGPTLISMGGGFPGGLFADGTLATYGHFFQGLIREFRISQTALSDAQAAEFVTVPTTTSLTASSAVVAVGTNLTLTATVASAGDVPTGSVTFSSSAGTLGTAALNASGVATLTTAALPLGASNLTASYGGAASFASSASSAITQTVISTLEAWRIAQGLAQDGSGTAANTADPDGDGLVNFLEYALGRDPLTADSTAPTTATVDGTGKLQLTFKRARPATELTFKRARPATELTYTVQASSDLATWTDLAVNPGTVGQNVTEPDAPPADAKRRFMRLKVSVP
jgi:hypothetical protein